MEEQRTRLLRLQEHGLVRCELVQVVVVRSRSLVRCDDLEQRFRDLLLVLVHEVEHLLLLLRAVVSSRLEAALKRVDRLPTLDASAAARARS